VERLAITVPPALTSTTEAAERPWKAAKTVCLPGLTNIGSSIGDLPTVRPSMLRSAPTASTLTTMTPAFFLASVMPFCAVVFCSGVAAGASRRNCWKWFPASSEWLDLSSLRPMLSRMAGVRLSA
jgi:hypothetical protein